MAKVIKISGYVLLPKKKKERDASLKGIYQTLFVDKGYLREFQQRWRPGARKFKAKLVIEC